MPKSTSISQYFKSTLLRVLFKGFALLPLSWLRGIGRWLGSLVFSINTRDVKVTRKNIQLCLTELPAQEQEQLTKLSTQASMMCALESAWAWFNPRAKVTKQIVEVSGIEHLKRAQAQQQPLVLTGAHLGNWEVLLNWIAAFDDCAIAYKPPKSLAMDPVVRKAREATGVTMITGDRSGIEQMFTAASSGKPFVILSDQRPGKRGGVFAPFFNLPAFTMTIVQKLVQQANAQLLYFHALRVPSGFKVIITPAAFDLTIPDEIEFATALNAGLSEIITTYPSQFEWSYRRFRPLPEGFEPVYTQLK
ncbi:MAG: lysophospholipid acyltransferase family protein [Gammaproteobacteria bacterium]|nr:lysophospholipid acyltransferase family protein [Gammaproteobacteria bacterium]